MKTKKVVKAKKVVASLISRMMTVASFDKAKNLILTNIKVMSSGSQVTKSVKLNKAQQKLLKDAGSYQDFRRILHKDLKVASALQVDSQAKKQQLTRNTAYDGTTDTVAKALDKPAFRITAARAKGSKKVKAKAKAKVKAKK